MYDFLAEGQPVQPVQQRALAQWKPPAPVFSPAATAILGAVGLAAGGAPGALGAVLITRVGNYLGQEEGTLFERIKSEVWREPLMIGGAAGLVVGGLIGYWGGKR